MTTLEQRMALLIERIAMGSRLDEHGLNHDNDSLMEIASRVRHAGCAWSEKELKAIAFAAMQLHLEFIRTSNGSTKG